MSTKQSAVDYLYYLVKMGHHITKADWERARGMEKEQLIENNKLKAIVEFYEQGCGKEGCKVKESHVH